MNGMHQGQGWASAIGGDYYTVSYHYELAPASTLAQLSLSSFSAYDDDAFAWVAFTSCQYLDSLNVLRTDTFDFTTAAPKLLVRNRLVRADFVLNVRDAYASFISNFFFWDNVS